MPWYSVSNLHEIDTPALIVYPDRVRQNIRAAITMAGHPDRLRPHIKTCKSEGAIRMMLEEGITKFKCATIAEAELLAICGAPDVLLAYQPQGPKIERLASLAQHYPAVSFSCLVDNEAAAAAINQEFNKRNLRIRVFVDLNVGMNRTGIKPGDEVVALYRFIHAIPALIAGGLHAYDGHIREANPALLKKICDDAFAHVDTLVEKLVGEGLPVPSIIAGGSVTFPVHASRPDVECSPGTFVYWDQNYSTLCASQPFQPAALVITRVISRPADGVATTDLGHKSIASENDLLHRVHFLNAPTVIPIGHSEEHLVLGDEANELKTGDVLYGLPWHICPTVALFDRAITVEIGNARGEWPAIARDRKINY